MLQLLYPTTRCRCCFSFPPLSHPTYQRSHQGHLLGRWSFIGGLGLIPGRKGLTVVSVSPPPLIKPLVFQHNTDLIFTNQAQIMGLGKSSCLRQNGIYRLGGNYAGPLREFNSAPRLGGCRPGEMSPSLISCCFPFKTGKGFTSGKLPVCGGGFLTSE